MIVNHRGHWLYAGIPKTASTTLHSYLKAPPFCGVDTGPEEQHRMEPPEGAGEFRVLTVVRNPFTRALSLWRHARLNEFPGIGLAALLRSCPSQDDPFYRWRQIDFVRCLMLPEVVHLEDLAGGLSRFFGTATLPEIPRLNETDSCHCQAELTPDLVELITANYREDFAAFGYSFIPPWKIPRHQPRTEQCQLAVRH